MTGYENRVKRLRAQGRGAGHNSNYKPWLTPQDFSSDGRTHEVNISRTGGVRKHIFFSDLEHDVFLYYDFLEKVVDVREQYPLLDRNMSMVIARELGVKHPCNEEGEAFVMTTDLLIDYIEDGEYKQAVRSVKPSGELEKRRVIEKLAIEREYFRRKLGIEDWRIITEQDISPVMRRNLNKVCHCLDLNESQYFSCFLPEEIETLKKSFLTELEMVNEVEETIRKIEEDFNLNPGAGRTIYKNLIANHQIRINLEKEIMV